jgi:hypothetical protein
MHHYCGRFDRDGGSGIPLDVKVEEPVSSLKAIDHASTAEIVLRWRGAR